MVIPVGGFSSLMAPAKRLSGCFTVLSRCGLGCISTALLGMGNDLFITKGQSPGHSDHDTLTGEQLIFSEVYPPAILPDVAVEGMVALASSGVVLKSEEHLQTST